MNQQTGDPDEARLESTFKFRARARASRYSTRRERALPQRPKSDFSFIPGLSPVMNGNESRGTVLTVWSSGQSNETVEHEGVTSTADEETVKTVSYFVTAPDTGLKPGVNESSDFGTLEAKLRESSTATLPS